MRGVPPVRTLVNLSGAGAGYGGRTVLRDVSLGVAAGDRVGVVGRNGGGKSTLLRLIARALEPDEGHVVHEGGLSLALMGQGDDLGASGTIGPATRLCGRGSTGSSAAWRWPAYPGARRRPCRRCRAGSGGGSAWRAS
jgi:energy-coupling factor transporter ATP-binding protein EcfA2